MNPDFDFNPSHDSSQRPGARSNTAIERDRFELLSAYMDGEVTAAERRQVEEWLANDASVQQLHRRLLQLRSAFQAMPVPTVDEQSVQQTIDAVMTRIDRRPKLRLIWGGAIAAVAAGAVALIAPGQNGWAPQLATNLGTKAPSERIQSSPNAAPSEAVLVALDQPLVEIPKAAVSVTPTIPNTVGAGTTNP